MASSISNRSICCTVVLVRVPGDGDVDVDKDNDMVMTKVNGENPRAHCAHVRAAYGWAAKVRGREECQCGRRRRAGRKACESHRCGW